MKMSLNREELFNYLSRQLNVFFPDGNEVKYGELAKYSDTVLQKMECCFSKVNNRYFFDGKSAVFNHLNGDQYSMFLYFVSNTIYKNNGDISLSTKIFLLNKLMFGIDVFYEVELPDIFLFVHPLGTVLGRGKYSNYLLVYQKCNIGSNKNIYPTLGEHLSLHPGSSVLGNCTVGKNCKLSAGSLLMDMDLEDNSIYIGNPKDNTIKKSVKHNSIWK